jgi:uncharacterized protein YutE (UPF0331/DUF86 family)
MNEICWTCGKDLGYRALEDVAYCGCGGTWCHKCVREESAEYFVPTDELDEKDMVELKEEGWDIFDIRTFFDKCFLCDKEAKKQRRIQRTAKLNKLCRQKKDYLSTVQVLADLCEIAKKNPHNNTMNEYLDVITKWNEEGLVNQVEEEMTIPKLVKEWKKMVRDYSAIEEELKSMRRNLAENIWIMKDTYRRWIDDQDEKAQMELIKKGALLLSSLQEVKYRPGSYGMKETQRHFESIVPPLNL